MDCIIIEDGENVVEHLENQLKRTGYEINILARIDSVSEAVSWLSKNQTDLIFLDIQLSDGLSFEIFDHIQVTTPVIFTTSYDDYIMRAFEVNSLSYLLKPVNTDRLKIALDKYSLLSQQDSNMNAKMLSLNRDYQERFLVRNGRFLQKIAEEDVAYFYSKRFLFLSGKDGQQYLYDTTLELLEQRLNPRNFFRISRQCIVSSDIIKKVTGIDDNRRLKIETDEQYKDELIVSRHRVAEFKAWLDR